MSAGQIPPVRLTAPLDVTSAAAFLVRRVPPGAGTPRRIMHTNRKVWRVAFDELGHFSVHGVAGPDKQPFTTLADAVTYARGHTVPSDTTRPRVYFDDRNRGRMP